MNKKHKETMDEATKEKFLAFENYVLENENTLSHFDEDDDFSLQITYNGQTKVYDCDKEREKMETIAKTFFELDDNQEGDFEERCYLMGGKVYNKEGYDIENLMDKLPIETLEEGDVFEVELFVEYRFNEEDIVCVHPGDYWTPPEYELIKRSSQEF